MLGQNEKASSLLTVGVSVRKLNKNRYAFKIEYMVEEGMTKPRNLDRRPSSRIYRIGANGEEQNHFVTTEAQMAPNSISSTVSCVKCHADFKTNTKYNGFFITLCFRCDFICFLILVPLIPHSYPR